MAADSGASRRVPVRVVSGALVLLLASVAAALVAGCKSDQRISVAELQKREAELAAARDPEPVSVNPTELNLTEVRPVTVSAGDVLTITLTGIKDEYSELAVRARVHQAGRVSLPLVGWVDVGGKSLEEVEQAIYAAFVPGVVKQLSVFCELTGPEATTVMVAGAAAQRGLITLRSDERNVLYALARSGGFAPGTSGRIRVRPIRADRPEVVYDLMNVNDVRRAMTAPPLESGDLVAVEPAITSAVYVMGLVKIPQTIPIAPEGTLPVSRAVAAAGGLLDFLEPEEATVVRKLADGSNVHVKLALADIIAGKAPDFELRPGDIFEVPHTGDTLLRSWALNNIRIGPFGVGTIWDPVAEYRYQRALDEDSIGGGSFRQSVLDTVRFGLPNVIVPAIQPPAP